MTIRKYNLTLSEPTTAGGYQRTGDIIGKLSAVHIKNVSFTSDVRLTMFRSSSTHKTNMIFNLACPHGTTMVYLRPRFDVRFSSTAGSTSYFTKCPTQSTAMAFAMMEFADEPLVVMKSSHKLKGGVTCNLTVYMED